MNRVLFTHLCIRRVTVTVVAVLCLLLYNDECCCCLSSHIILILWCGCCGRALNPMFGDYFQHDAHELLRCVLMHVDEAIIGLREFCGNAIPMVTKSPLQSSSALHGVVTRSSSPAAGKLISTLTLSHPSSLLTEAAQVRHALSPHVNGDRQEAERIQQLPVFRHCKSLPSSPCTSLVVDLCMPQKCKSVVVLETSSPQHLCGRLKQKQKSSPVTGAVVDLCMPQKCVSAVALPNISHHQLSYAVTVLPNQLCGRKQKERSLPCTNIVVDLCMPRKCKSLGVLQNSSQLQLSAAMTVSPDQLCDRLKRKRKSSWSFLTYYECVPVKCKNFTSSCFGSVVDCLNKNYESATSSSSNNGSFTQMCTSVQQVKLSNELLMCSSGDSFREGCKLAQLTDDAKLVCDTSCTSSVSSVGIPVSTVWHSLASGYTSWNVKDQLLLSLQALENGRSCFVSLCSEEITGLSSETACHQSSTLKSVKNFTKTGNVCQHFACVRDIFGGQMLTQTKCLNCGSIVSHIELYEDIALFTGHYVRRRKCHFAIVILPQIEATAQYYNSLN